LEKLPCPLNNPIQTKQEFSMTLQLSWCKSISSSVQYVTYFLTR
jgi:hypothetical protein